MTLSRVVLIVPIIFLINNSEVFWALALFILAGLTDYLDGFIARKTKTETSLGALLDLLADTFEEHVDIKPLTVDITSDG